MSAPIDDWNLLRSFVAVFDTGTLTQAARLLHMTQPSVGRHIRALEAHMGETLFDRLPGQLRPNARATALYERAAAMRDAAQAVIGVMSDRPQQVAGVVRISCSEAFSIQVLPASLAALLQAEPQLEVELVVSNASDNLIKRDADIAVRFYQPQQDDLIATRVGSIEVGLFASRAYLERHGPPAGLGDPAQLWIGYDRSTVASESAQRRGVKWLRSDFRFRTDSVLAQQAAIEAGLGIGSCLVPMAQRNSALQRVLPQLVSVPLDIWLCAHEDLRRSVRLRRVYDHLAAHLRADFGAAIPAAPARHEKAPG